MAPGSGGLRLRSGFQPTASRILRQPLEVGVVAREGEGVIRLEEHIPVRIVYEKAVPRALNAAGGLHFVEGCGSYPVQFLFPLVCPREGHAYSATLPSPGSIPTWRMLA